MVVPITAFTIVIKTISERIDMDISNLLYPVMALGGSCIIVGLSHIIDRYLCKHPGKSRPANGKTPLVLGSGNGIGVGMFGEFIRKNGVQASYSFLCFIIPLIPLGCYDSCISNFKSESYKRQTTTYQMTGSQPWRVLELISIYCRYWGGVAIFISIISVIASFF